MPRGRRKEIHYGTKELRTVVHDRTDKRARPWNHPQVVDASYAYSVPFGSYKEVARFENMLEGRGDLETKDRFSCGPCGKLKGECVCGGKNEQN